VTSRRPAGAPTPIKAVVFDVGETIVDETRAWSEWADWLGIPRLTLFAVLGGVIARGDSHQGVFDVLRPGMDIHAESTRMRAARATTWVNATDLYPDALPAIAALRDAGYLVGIAGNQPRETEQVIASLGIPLDLVASSDGLGVAKPDAAFFERVADELHVPPAAIAYVGDRIDNDVVPAAGTGMLPIFIRRGPWAYLQALDGVPPGAIEIESLVEIPAVLAALGSGRDTDPDPDGVPLGG
jgi:FMN phosphatase YigB (HAD superfamily)